MNVAAAIVAIGLLTGPVQAGTENASKIPEEDYSFLSVFDGRCVPKIGVGIDAGHEAECQRMNEPRRYRGTWFVAFETSIFTPAGNPSCIEGVTLDYCPDLILEGRQRPWPGRWACARKLELEFVGRRSAFPGPDLNYRVVADRVISAKRLPDPPYEVGDCDETAP